MGDSDFVTNFYNLRGDTIVERKKNFYKLLKAQSVPLTEEDLKGLNPRTYLEKLFEIDIFIYFNLSAKLLNVIKDGNAVFICKILKQPKILKTILGNISPEKFVNEFLPRTSYMVRMKILKRISFFLEESHMEKVIACIHKRYGLTIALKILHTRSSSIIKENLLNHKVILKPRQVKYIFNKDPQLFVVYLEHYREVTGKIFSHNNILKYIAQKKPDFWLKLWKEKKVSSVNVGRRTSKYIIDHYNDHFLSNVLYYSEFLRLDIIVRKLNGHFKDIYMSVFPKKITLLNSDDFSSQLLKYYPKNKKWALFEQVFKEVFQKDIMDNLQYLNHHYVPMFPNKIVKTKWAEAHYDYDECVFDRNKYLKLCDTSKAIPLIKEKINATSFSEKSNLLKLLVKNCRAHNDTIALESVLLYIWKQHTHDEIIFTIVDTVANRFHLGELNETHWSCLNEIIAFLRMSNRLKYNSNKFFLGYIEYLYLHGKPYKNELMSFLRDIHSKNISFDIEVEDLEFKKRLFIEIINVYANENEFGEKFEIITLIYNINDFNKKHPEYYINMSDFPCIVACIKSLYEKNYANLHWEEKYILHDVTQSNLKFMENPIVKIEKSTILKICRDDKFVFDFDYTIQSLITKHNRTDFENDLLQMFWDRFEKNVYIRKRVVRWFQVNDPISLTPYIEKIFEYKCINPAMIKLMSHLNFDKKIVDYCTEKLENYVREITSPTDTSDDSDTDEDTEIDETLAQIIKGLSVLLPTNKYIELIEKLGLIPANSGMEGHADKSFRKIYLLQCELARSFRQTQEPMKTLPTFMKFCMADNLNSALPSICGIFYETPETFLHPFFELLFKKSAAVKKHALYLGGELLDLTTVNRLQNINESGLDS